MENKMTEKHDTHTLALLRAALNRSTESLKRVSALAKKTVAATAFIGLMLGGQASADEMAQTPEAIAERAYLYGLQHAIF